MTVSGSGPAVRVDHVGLWVRDLENMREFYERQLGGRSGPLYCNERTGFRSYFVSFAGGTRVELMARPGAATSRAAPTATGGEAGATSAPDGGHGHAHLALSVGSREDVDARVSALAAAGVEIASGPRRTGDGYYEAVVLDPEGNRIEIIAG